jgi:transcriptional regulator with XRE-family HTH domain
MDANLQNIHIGSIIKEVLTKKSMTVTEFGNKINRERTTVYDIFSRKSIDIDLLIQISNVLDYDFIHEVYFPQNNATPHTAPHKILIAIEVDVNEVKKLELPKEIYCLVKTDE